MAKKTELDSISVPWNETHGGNHHEKDEIVWGRLEKLIEERAHPTRHLLELFPAYVRRFHFKRFLAHYELLKMSADVPGIIVEIGVYRGASLLTWGKLVDIVAPLDRQKRVYGFDSFEGLQDFDEKDGPMDPVCSKTEGGWSARSAEEEVDELVSIANADGLIPSGKINLVKGNIFETLPKFMEAVPGFRISLLHMDVDLYKPTKFALEKLYPLVSRGGVIVFDEYALPPWEGETNAVDDYFKEIGEKPVVQKLPFTNLPSGYIVKE